MHNLYNYLGRFEKPHGEFEVKTDLTLACSRFLLEKEKDRLVRGSSRQAVVYNGVDTETFLPPWQKGSEAPALRRRYGLEEKKVVLYTGKIRGSKGVMLLVSAMKEVFSQEPKAHLVLAGGTGFGYKRADKKTEFFNLLQQGNRSLSGPGFTDWVYPAPRYVSHLSVGRYFCCSLAIGRGLGDGLFRGFLLRSSFNRHFPGRYPRGRYGSKNRSPFERKG